MDLVELSAVRILVDRSSSDMVKVVGVSVVFTDVCVDVDCAL